jgi:hypothetical protein
MWEDETPGASSTTHNGRKRSKNNPRDSQVHKGPSMDRLFNIFFFINYIANLGFYETICMAIHMTFFNRRISSMEIFLEL